jgi:hypothetical protein
MLARAMEEAVTLDRVQCRAHAERDLSLTRMVDLYEGLYVDLLAGGLAA